MPGMGRSTPTYLRLIDEPAGKRCDVTPLFAGGDACPALVDDLLGLFAGTPFDVIAGIDALGFVLGGAMAFRAGCGFIAVRKVGKLSVTADRVEFVDYSGETKALEVRPGAVTPGSAVLVIDEWIGTGAQASTAATLIERQGGIVAGITAIAADAGDGARSLSERCTVRTIR
jgi:adenine phosphoribosyltransferase